MGDIEFGEIDGFPEGAVLASRMELVKAGLTGATSTASRGARPMGATPSS
jgi:hypothetical protein